MTFDILKEGNFPLYVVGNCSTLAEGLPGNWMRLLSIVHRPLLCLQALDPQEGTHAFGLATTRRSCIEKDLFRVHCGLLTAEKDSPELLSITDSKVKPADQKAGCCRYGF